MASQSEVESIMREAGILGGSVLAQPAVQRQPGPKRSSTDIGPFGLGTVPDEARQPRVEPAMEFPSRREITADVLTGAPLLDRLAGAFKFDRLGVENYLKDKYGKSNVFRGSEGDLFFLPPDQLSLPEDDRTFVKFDANGLDVGDIVEFVPAAVGAIGGIAGAALSGSASVPITLAALTGGGALGEAAVQGVGAALPGEEPTATPGARAGRIALSGAAELGGGVIGEIAQRAIPTALRQGNELARRGVQRAVRAGVPPEQIAARERLGRRVGQEFTEGQLSGSNAALMTERLVRQFIGTTDMATAVDTQQLARLGEEAARQIQKLSTEGGEGGAQAAVGAFDKYVNELVTARSNVAGPLFRKARSIVGNERVIPLNRTMETIDELVEDYSSDLSSSVSEKIVSFLKQRKDKLPSDGTSISRMQNMLRDWGSSAAKGRDVIPEVKNPALERRIAAKMFGALQDDLENASNLILRRSESGRFESASNVREAAEALQNARTVFREMSEPLNEIVDNPLGEFIKDPERLIGQFVNSGRSRDKVESIMSFLDKTAPEQANQLRASVIDEVIRKARRGNPNEPISPARLVSISNNNQRRLDVLFAGNTQAKSAYNDMIESARILANQGRLQGSQTLPLHLINKLIAVVGAPVVAGSAFAGADLSSAQEEIGIVVASLLGSRWLARSMFNPPAARAYSRVFRAASRPRLSSGAKKAVRQALVDIISYNERLETTGRDPRNKPQRVSVSALGGVQGNIE